jgi:hypothetical protein
MTRAVEQNTPRATKEPIQPAIQQVFSRIQHVLYIVRENRTYDQVLGDIPQANGDPRLVLFGRRITPNAHRLAERYVLLDNFYANGEVSQDGHSWCDSAYATDFTQKAWMYRYSGRGILDQDGRLSSSPGGTIWTLAGQHGLQYRNYGEGSDRPDAAWRRISRDFFEARDTNRADVFIQELAEAEKTGNWPQLMVMSLATDHTQGLLPGAYSPIADIADNDLALGRIVGAISRSRFWNSTAIFAVEDDAQDGPDHVDSHRTIALAISPYIRRKAVDHTQYTQVSILRTIELIFNLPSMTQFDSAATPLTNLFTDSPDFDPYVPAIPEVDMTARNPREGPDAVASLQLDFSAADRANPKLLNSILWRAVRPGEKEPVSVRGFFSQKLLPVDDDDR